jgi:hypothetical protein
MASIRDGDVDVNAYADVEQAHRWAEVLEDAEAKRLGCKVQDARRALACRLGIAPGTLENLRRFRIKTVPSWMMARLRREFVALLQTQIMRLEHEIHIARQTGADYRDDDLASAETQVARAKEILNGTGGT